MSSGRAEREEAAGGPGPTTLAHRTSRRRAVADGGEDEPSMFVQQADDVQMDMVDAAEPTANGEQAAEPTANDPQATPPIANGPQVGQTPAPEPQPANQRKVIDIDKFGKICLTIKKRWVRRDEADVLIIAEYAKLFNQLSEDAVPDSDISKRLSEVALIVVAKASIRYLHNRNKSEWAGFMKRAVKRTEEEHETIRGLKRSLVREKDGARFDESILHDAELRLQRANKVLKMHTVVIADVREYMRS